eukprot:CAMPEP_0168344534 /NCGR_PEP_ID=MMETSP0213-20121227/16888_1 /TAXON_ID=151035 /ORGANISM="Euplotes harpa, Strain FSP1.4" /LENGTH=229 /DNA_ID=CAMNT_0008352323 /DNA_START=1 /DNA_END=690 /DNA_ORIENTATION=-
MNDNYASTHKLMPAHGYNEQVDEEDKSDDEEHKSDDESEGEDIIDGGQPMDNLFALLQEVCVPQNSVVIEEKLKEYQELKPKLDYSCHQLTECYKNMYKYEVGKSQKLYEAYVKLPPIIGVSLMNVNGYKEQVVDFLVHNFPLEVDKFNFNKGEGTQTVSVDDYLCVLMSPLKGVNFEAWLDNCKFSSNAFSKFVTNAANVEVVMITNCFIDVSEGIQFEGDRFSIQLL